MWIAGVLMCLSLVAVAISGYLNGKGHNKVEAFLIAFIAGSTGFGAINYANSVGIEASKVMGGGNYYEVIVTTPVPGKGTLVYAVDLDGNEGKTDILAKYPIDGYKIEQVGKRTFFLPEGTRITLDKDGEIVLVSEEGEAISVPIVATGK